jgi:hypothetical protein
MLILSKILILSYLFRISFCHLTKEMRGMRGIKGVKGCTLRTFKANSLSPTLDRHLSITRASTALKDYGLSGKDSDVEEPKIEVATVKVIPSTPSYLDQQPTPDEVSSLLSFLRTKKSLLVITGAGVSTSSGVPDYRGPLGSYKQGKSYRVRLRLGLGLGLELELLHHHK